MEYFSLSYFENFFIQYFIIYLKGMMKIFLEWLNKVGYIFGSKLVQKGLNVFCKQYL